MKYRFNKKEEVLVLGRFRGLKAVQAREARDTAKSLLASGKDPSLHAKRVKLANIERAGRTFEHFARQWFDSQKAQWKEVHSNDVITSMEKDLFPDLGEHPIADIDEAMLLATLRKVEKRGAIETARRLRQPAERVFRFEDLRRRQRQSRRRAVRGHGARAARQAVARDRGRRPPARTRP